LVVGRQLFHLTIVQIHRETILLKSEMSNMIWGLAVFVVWGLSTGRAFVLGPSVSSITIARESGLRASGDDVEEVDVIVVGDGIGGLSCGALTSKYGLKTLCLEAHDTPGGVAHSFSRYSPASKTPFRFGSGPSLITGLSSMSTNPLRQVLDAIGTADEIDWKKYDGWLVHDFADGKAIRLTAGDGGEFEKALSAYIPPFALRGGGLAAVASISGYLLKLTSIGTQGLLVTRPFMNVMKKYDMGDPFIHIWFDYLAFALSGVDASNTQGAPGTFIFVSFLSLIL
jgi:hypothetical protein